MVMTRSDRENRRTQDGFVMDCPLCGAYLRWAHLEASSHGSLCTFCGTTRFGTTITPRVASYEQLSAE